MQLSDFEYDLPAQLIAQYPLPERADARMLVVGENGNSHAKIKDVGQYLEPGDLLVVNNTQVIKARINAHKDSGGKAEILLERILAPNLALCQLRVSKPLKPGGQITVGEATFTCKGRQGQFYELQTNAPVLEVLEQYGHVPLPPYIARPDEAELDETRYQTVFSSTPGAVAAPTAGLHFTSALLNELQGKGIGLAEITLHVGAGTFQPVRASIAEHKMHQEFYQVSTQAAEQIQQTRAAGGRIVAVGTTVVRTLESVAALHAGEVIACEGETRLFITPGYEFQIVDTLVTNFHLPGSTLLMLVSAFAGYSSVMAAYQEAIQAGYRFFSYGDAMLLSRANAASERGL